MARPGFKLTCRFSLATQTATLGKRALLGFVSCISRIENVSRLTGKNLQIVGLWLECFGYHVAVFKTDPVELGWPVRRTRVYLWATKTAMQNKDPHLGYARLKGPPESLATVEALVCHTRAWAKRQLDHNRNSGQKWKDRVLQQLLEKPVIAGQSSSFELGPVHASVVEEHQAFLCERELHVLSFALEEMPLTRFVDVSQNPGRAATGTASVVPCVTPGGRIYDIKHKRFLTGRLKLHCQAIFPNQPEEFSLDLLESDLAGNAFNGAVFCAVFSTALIAEPGVFCSNL